MLALVGPCSYGSILVHLSRSVHRVEGHKAEGHKVVLVPRVDWCDRKTPIGCDHQIEVTNHQFSGKSESSHKIPLQWTARRARMLRTRIELRPSGLEYSDSTGNDRDESYTKATFGAQRPLAR
jgi:hypothetical protein